MGEGNLSLLRKADPRDGTRRGVIHCHMATYTEASILDPTLPNFAAIHRAIAEAGYPILATRQASDNWANDAGIAKVTLAKTYLQGTLGAKSGKVFLVAASMGGALAMAYARANPTLVQGILLMLPVSDLQDMVTNNRGGFASSVNAAYSGGYSNGTYGATHNPTTFAASLAGIPVWCGYATDDPIAVASTVTGVMSAIGGVVLNPVTGGHSDASFGNMSLDSMLAFLAANA